MCVARVRECERIGVCAVEYLKATLLCGKFRKGKKNVVVFRRKTVRFSLKVLCYWQKNALFRKAKVTF